MRETPAEWIEPSLREADDAVRAAYDRVPYPQGFHAPTHPDHLAVRAFLHGMEPDPQEGCRVLELGCVAGGNLLPPGGRGGRARPAVPGRGRLRPPGSGGLPPGGRGAPQGLRRRPDRAKYLEFLRNRAFRRRLRCHAELRLDSTPAPERLRRLHASSFVKPAGASLELAPGVVEAFLTGQEKTFTSSHPITKAALVRLAEAWPAALAFEDLAAVVEARLGASAEDVPRFSPMSSIRSTRSAWSTSTWSPPRLTMRVSERPLITQLARAEAAAGPPDPQPAPAVD